MQTVSLVSSRPARPGYRDNAISELAGAAIAQHQFRECRGLQKWACTKTGQRTGATPCGRF